MKNNDVICVGTALIDSIIQGFDPNPVSVSGYTAQSGSLYIGGEAVNEAVAFAKLGTKVGILCFLGEDAAGAFVEQELKRIGVDTDLIVWEKNHPTPVTSMFVKTDGSRMSVTNLAHRHNFHPETKGIEKLGAKAISIGSLFRAPFDDPEVIHSVLSSAKAGGMKIFADTKIPNFHPLSLENIKSSLPLIDYITPNEDEAKYFTEEEEPEAQADVFLRHGISNVIIKLGGKGCYFKNEQEEIRLPAFEIDPVDATGAGDNFTAGFVTELLKGKTHEEALLFGNACGAICTSAIGAGTGLKDSAQIETFIKQYPGKMES
ncbi:MAG: carbohydrate kinase family protein [Parasporobacterium sp.]|nr:carbohydrate kinase family protein [Parasporobacterium sp.]